MTDLSERKRAEAAQQLFADLARNIPIGLLIYQLDRRSEPHVLRVRVRQCRGVPPAERATRSCGGWRCEGRVSPAIPDEQLRRYADVAATGRADDFGEFQYGDDRVAKRWWSVQTFPLPDRSVGVAFQDISDRKRAEADIRQLNEHLEERVLARTAELAEANRDLAHKNDENEMFVYSVSHDLRCPLVNLQGFSKELEKGCNG